MRALVLLMTDIVGSTRLWTSGHEAMSAAMRRHRQIVHGLIEAYGGVRPLDQGEGDSAFAVFESASAAVRCAAEIQRGLTKEDWATPEPIRVRIGLHVGEVEERDGNVYGDAVNRCARLRGLASAGQTLLTAATYELVRDSGGYGFGYVDLGEHRMKDLSRAERVWQLSGPGLDGPFPPLASLDRVRHNLPVQTSTFIGREHDLAHLVALIRGHRLVTVTGFGGIGKTRLALQAAAELADGSMGDVWFVDLAAADDAAVVPARIAEVVGVRYGEGDATDALVRTLRDQPTLLVLDNLEQVLSCADFIVDMLQRAPSVRVLATSREVLRVRGERQLPISALAVPESAVSHDKLATYEAVRLFIDRAVSVRPDFVIDNASAPAVAAVCVRLDGHPLALELAAARLKVLSVDNLLQRLDSALSVLTGGSRDMPERHRTLRATIAWSYHSLSADEQLLLTRMSVLDGPASFDMVDAVCGEGLDLLDVLSSLLDKSLVRAVETDRERRFGLLVSIREYAAEQLPAAARREILERYADYVHSVLRLGLTSSADDSYRRRHAWVDRELAHVRAALAHRRAAGSPSKFAALVRALDDTFLHRGLGTEMLELVTSALAMVDEAEAETVDAEIEAGLVAISLLAGRHTLADADRVAALRCAAAARRCSDPIPRVEALLVALPRLAQNHADVVAALAEIDDVLAHGMPATHGYLDERAHVASRMLRYVDPDGALHAIHNPYPEMAGPVRISEVLLDRGDWRQSLSLLEQASDRALTGTPNPVWRARIEGGRARALAQAGRLSDARLAAEAAYAFEVQAGVIPMESTPTLAALARRAGKPAAALATLDRALAAPALRLNPVSVAALQWRRAVCLRELRRPDEASADLAAAREVLAASELYGPRELLGALVERAAAVLRDDARRAAAIIASVQARRGQWVLPFEMDLVLEELLAVLPEYVGPPPPPAEAW